MEGRALPLKLYEKNTILDSCFHVFTERGYAGTTTAMLAEAAGISRTLIFHHFESKKKLYLTIVERQFEKSAPELSRFSPEDFADYFEAKDARGLSNVEQLKNDPDTSRLMFEAFYATPKGLKADIEDLKKRMAHKFGERHARQELEMRKLFGRVPLRDEVDPDQAYELIGLVSEHFRKKCLEEMADDETTTDDNYWDAYFARTKAFTDMIRFGIERKGSKTM
jgi:TetR/AcrR family transcriptional regulator